MNFQRLLSKLSIGVVAMGISGCFHPPTTEQISKADYGPYPQNYEAIVKSFFNAHLKDPYSVQMDAIPLPTQGWLSFMGTTDYGWKTCIRYNAKNSYGGYVGYKTEYLLIRNDQIIQQIEDADRVAANMGMQLC